MTTAKISHNVSKKIDSCRVIAIAATFVLIVAIPVKPPEHICLLAYAQDGGDSYSDGYDRGYKDGQDHPIMNKYVMVCLDIMKNIVEAI